jgi:hypothetical protein
LDDIYISVGFNTTVVRSGKVPFLSGFLFISLAGYPWRSILIRIVFGFVAGGRGGQPRKPKTKEELDAEMDAYMLGDDKFAQKKLDNDMDEYVSNGSCFLVCI